MIKNYITSWTMAQAKRDFPLGIVKGWRIDAIPMQPGCWGVVLLGFAHTDGPLVDVRSKEVRCFKTLDAAVGALVEIGFRVESLYGTRA